MTLTEKLMEKFYEEVKPDDQYRKIPYDHQLDVREHWDDPRAGTGSVRYKCVCTKDNDLGYDGKSAED